MALSKSGLKGRIEANLHASFPSSTQITPDVSALAEAIANAVIDEFQANGQVSGLTTSGGPIVAASTAIL